MAAPRNNVYGAIPITQPNPRNASLSLHARGPGAALSGGLRVAAADGAAAAEVSANQSEELAPDDSESDDVAMTLTQDDLNRLSALTGKNLLTRDDLISQ